MVFFLNILYRIAVLEHIAYGEMQRKLSLLLQYFKRYALNGYGCVTAKAQSRKEVT